MKKTAGRISVILKGILCIGFSIQIVLGIIWMCFNFASLQEFKQTEGILYRGLRNLVGSRYWLLYGLQLVAAYVTADRFLQRLHPMGLFWRVWGNLVLVTFPVAMQCHLAVSPYSLVSSCVLMELSVTMAAVREKKENPVRHFAMGGLFWLILALLLPEYFILGAIPLLLVLLFNLPALLKQRRRLIYTLLLFSAYGGMILGFHTLTGETGYLPNRECVTFSLFSRTAWPTIMPDREYWPDEVRTVMEDYVWDTSLYADNMQIIFRPVMQRNFTDEQAAKYYLDMAVYSWKRHTPLVIRQIGGDALGYCVTLLILPMQLKGNAYASYSGRNYEMMFLHSPLVTKYYVNYSCWWFAVMLVLMVLLAAAEYTAHSDRQKRNSVFAVLLCLVTMGTIVGFYTLRGAGVMDYKCTPAVNLLWLVLVLLLMRNAALCPGRAE